MHIFLVLDMHRSSREKKREQHQKVVYISKHDNHYSSPVILHHFCSRNARTVHNLLKEGIYQCVKESFSIDRS